MRVLNRLAIGLVPLAIVFGGLEIALRLFPRAGKLLYYPGSVHYSVEGNRVAARAIAKFMEGLPASLAAR